MKPKKYSSYDEIEQDLAILKLEKEIYFQKIILSVDKTKESIFPFRKINDLLDGSKKILSGNLGTVLKLAIPFVGWYIKRKRGY